MSDANLLVRDLSAELEAALLGDFEVLKTGSPDAEHFAMAFGTDAGQRWWEETEPEGLLGVAAKALSSERRGEFEAAIELYEEVAAAPGWVGLLGLLLKGRSPLVADTESVHDAAERVRRLRRGARKARLLAKLSLFASDKGELEISHSLWSDALAAAPEHSELQRALWIEALNLGLVKPELDMLNSPPRDPNDELVWPTQVEQLLLSSATGDLAQSVEDRFGGTWRFTIRMGITPLDRATTADTQATWIGAPWLRRSIRKQIGAQLLSGVAEDPAQWAQGVLTWTLGGGSHANLALSYAEPHFDDESADYIVKAIGECDPTKNRFHRLTELGAEAWDLLSNEVLAWLAAAIPLVPGEGSPGPESRKIWAAYAIRLTGRWFDDYRKLEPERQAALLDSLNPASLRHFGEEIKVTMYAALGDDEQVLAERGALLPMAAALAPASEEKRLVKLMESGPMLTRIVAQIGEERPVLFTAAVKERVLTSLRQAIEETAKQARSGTINLGGAGPRLELGRILALVESPDRDLIDLLVDTAIDASMPPQYLSEARRGLVLARRGDVLRTADLERLRAAPDVPGQGPLDEGHTEGVLRNLLLRVLAAELNAQERSELISAIRSSDQRVRDLAVNTAAEALHTSRDEGLAWGVVSGLFDPSDTVASGALAGLEPLTEHFEAAAEVAWQRLPELFAASGRSVRADVINALKSASPQTDPQRERCAALLARARQDRSWLVRDAAAAVISDQG